MTLSPVERRARQAAYSKAWYETHRKERAAHAKAFRRANAEKLRAYNRAYYLVRPGRKSEEHRRRRYGLSADAFKALRVVQNFCCAMCGEKFLDDSFRIKVDHNHKTGVVRGLLCLSCNTAVGWFEQYHELIDRYLARYVSTPK